jgi:hypothetical protein
MMSVRRATSAALLLLVACSNGDSSSASSSSTTTTSTTTTTTSSTTTTTSLPGCVADERPAAAVRVTETSADLDGDGAMESVTVYADGTEAAPGPWHVLVTLGGGKGRIGTIVTDAATGDPNQRIELLGASPIAGGAGETLFVTIGSGASATIVGLFAAAQCNLTRLALAPSTAPAQFAVGGTVTHLDGLRCRDRQLEQLSATSADGVTYDTKVQRLTIGDGALVTVGAPTTAVLRGPNPELQEFATLDCPGVARP